MSYRDLIGIHITLAEWLAMPAIWKALPADWLGHLGHRGLIELEEYENQQSKRTA